MPLTATRREGLALRLLAILLGLFFVAMSLNKVQWITNPDLLRERFNLWVPEAGPYAQWYLEAVAIPGVSVFARLVPAGEFCVALALILGVRTHVAAAVALLMVVNFHFATGAFSSWGFLRDGTGPPVLGALLALMIAGRSLPFRVR